MHWLTVRKAKIKPEQKQTFEQYGPFVMQLALKDQGIRDHTGSLLNVELVREALLQWLTERADREERKEWWNFAMEVAITLLVGAELFMSLLTFWCGHAK